MNELPNAEILLRRMLDRYAKAQSYRDTGEHETVFISGPHPWHRRTTRKRFRTAFVRPDRFLFEYSEAQIGPESEWPRGAVWANATGVHLWNSIGTVNDRPQGHLAQGIAALTGVSGGTAAVVPSLLGLDIGGHAALCDASTARVVGSEHSDGRHLLVLEGHRSHNQSVRIWVDDGEATIMREAYGRVLDRGTREEMLAGMRARLESAVDDRSRDSLRESLRRMEERDTPSIRTESMTNWRPELDVQIDPHTFEYEPPGSHR